MNGNKPGKVTRHLSSIVVLALSTLFTFARAAEPAFSFSVVPQQTATKTALTWGPIIAYLEQRTGQRFHLVTAKDIPTFEQGIAEGRDDFSYMNPHHYTVFHNAPGYQPLVRARDKVIKGIIVVNNDSRFRDIHDLAGQSLAFPAPAAFAATMLVRGYLQQQGISITPNYVGSHDSVYLNVVKGFYPAGGGIVTTLEKMKPEVQQQLRILWTSPDYTPHAIAVHPRVAAEIAEAVQQALVALDTTEAGKTMLAAINEKGWVKAHDSDWDDVRSLNLNAWSLKE